MADWKFLYILKNILNFFIVHWDFVEYLFPTIPIENFQRFHKSLQDFFPTHAQPGIFYIGNTAFVNGI